jgi:hypothetical protein
MEDIYAKIQVAEENLRALRTELEAAEKAHILHGTAANSPSSITTTVLHFVVSTCASAKAAFLASRLRPM